MNYSMTQRFITLCVLSFGLLFAGNAMADKFVYLTCPELSAAEQLGNCPSQQELKEGYDATCPSAMAKRNQCKPFSAYIKSKGKAIWSVMMNGEEQLPYIHCGVTQETVRASKPQSVSVKSSLQTLRSEVKCTYENDFSLRFPIKGHCSTGNRGVVECKKDAQDCVVKCEIFE
ncbi:MAG: hypothetical protein OQK24_13610 [Magnetovibrio sp.]|nr:hypothetical protein [Magnetovibrio sp.]